MHSNAWVINFLDLDLNQGLVREADALPSELSSLNGIEALEIHLKDIG